LRKNKSRNHEHGNENQGGLSDAQLLFPGDLLAGMPFLVAPFTQKNQVPQVLIAHPGIRQMVSMIPAP
jgi:hypothetical protein